MRKLVQQVTCDKIILKSPQDNMCQHIIFKYAYAMMLHISKLKKPPEKGGLTYLLNKPTFIDLTLKASPASLILHYRLAQLVL